MQDAWGYTIFAEDIRQEIDEKFSIIGCLSGNLFFPPGTMPIIIPKLGLSIKLVLPIDFAPIEVEIFCQNTDGSIIFSNKVPIGETPEGEKTSPDGEPVFINFLQNITLSPLIITKLGNIRVRAKVNGEEIKLGALRIIEGQPNIATLAQKEDNPSSSLL